MLVLLIKFDSSSRIRFSTKNIFQKCRCRSPTNSRWLVLRGEKKTFQSITLHIFVKITNWNVWNSRKHENKFIKILIKNHHLSKLKIRKKSNTTKITTAWKIPAVFWISLKKIVKKNLPYFEMKMVQNFFRKPRETITYCKTSKTSKYLKILHHL